MCTLAREAFTDSANKFHDATVPNIKRAATKTKISPQQLPLSCCLIYDETMNKNNSLSVASVASLRSFDALVFTCSRRSFELYIELKKKHLMCLFYVII